MTARSKSKCNIYYTFVSIFFLLMEVCVPEYIASLSPEFSDDNLFEATGNELMKKTNDVPDLNNLESSATTSARTLTLGK